jgi:hypothetical protein
MAKLPQPSGDEKDWQKPQMFYGKPLTFNPKSHRYTWDGKPVPSVTTIISRLNKPLLVQWAANCAVEHIMHGIGAREGAVPLPQLLEEARKAHLTKKEDAADIGTAVHKYAQAALTGKPEPRDLPPGAIEACAAFWKWVEQHKIEPIAVERRVMSREHMYAGTCDFYGYIDDRLSVLDFKTGNGIYDEAWWQTSGYELALSEEGVSRGPVNRWIVHLNKETGECVTHCRLARSDDWNQDRNVWLSLLALDKALRIARKHPQPAKRKAA